MARNTRIATCCYCGTRAALVLKGVERHELSCAACGAPLHDMKMLRAEATADHPVERAPRPKTRRRGVTPPPLWEREVTPARPDPRRKKKRRKSLMKRAFSEAFDLIEDIFD